MHLGKTELSTSDDGREKRAKTENKRETRKVLNCHSKMCPLDAEKDVQTKAQHRHRKIDCIYNNIYIKDEEGGKVLRRRTSVAPIRARITPSARVSLAQRNLPLKLHEKKEWK